MNTLKKSNPFNENELIQSTKAEMRYAISKKLGRKSHKEVTERKNEILRELAKKEIETHDYQIKANLVRENIAFKKEKELSSGQPVKKESSESKESFESLMGWEKDTFKIDSTGRKKEIKRYDEPEHEFDESASHEKVKVSPAGDVFEFIEGSHKGKQIFVGYKNFLKYVAKAKGCTPKVAEKRYLMTPKQFKEKMNQIIASEGGYKAFYKKEIGLRLSTGYWSVESRVFGGVDIMSCVWLVGGFEATFGGDFKNDYSYDGSGGRPDVSYSENLFGFSGRLLKEPK